MKLPALKRPHPPPLLLKPAGEDLFVPAPEVADWAFDVFVNDASPLHNPDHAHLVMANVAFLWTNEESERQMNRVVGRAELTKPNPMLDAWAKSRHRAQFRGWFPAEDGEPWRMPDFLITLYAPFAAQADDATFCAVVEHELYHCALKRITSQGVPVWGIRGHDVEEFVGVTARYGPGASAGKTLEFVRAANRKPLIAAADIRRMCGTGLKLAA